MADELERARKRESTLVAVFSAIDARADVVPVSLRYSMRLPGPARGARQSAVAAYVGSDTEISTLSRVIAARGVAVRVHATEVIDASQWVGAGRGALAARAEAAVFADAEFLEAAPALPLAA